jgi:hypothetical protein
MSRNPARAVFTDVPYNLTGSEISGKGKVRHRSFFVNALFEARPPARQQLDD